MAHPRTDDDGVFRALADPTRRHLLDLLRERDGRSLSELESGLEMTRFGVAKHLAVLEAAGLVVAVRRGRQKLHHLNAVPIAQVHERWTSAFTARRASALLALRDHLEEPVTVGAESTAAATHVERIFVRAAPQAIWDAITRPEWTEQYFHATRVDVELSPGGRYLMHGTGDQDGVLLVDGEVVVADSPHRLVHTWRPLWDPALVAEGARTVTWTIDEVRPGVCRLTVMHDLADAPVTRVHVRGDDGGNGGWGEVLSGLKTVVETGTPLG